MTKVLRPHDYETSVFINCPFDSAYEPLLHGIIFAVLHMNLKPKPGIKLFSLPFLKCVSGSIGMAITCHSRTSLGRFTTGSITILRDVSA